jgi:hypothetical protein
MTITKNTVPASTARDGDALATLAAQHVDLLRRCARIESTAEGAGGFCDALLAHLAFEDEVVNPAARRAITSPLLDDLEVEHEIARDLVRQVRAMDEAGPMFAATLRVLARYVRAHIDVEVSALVPRLAAALVDCELVEQWPVEGPQRSTSGTAQAPSARFIHPRIAQKLVSGKDARVAASGSDRRANDEPAPSRTFYDRSADIDRDWGRIADG